MSIEPGKELTSRGSVTFERLNRVISRIRKWLVPVVLVAGLGIFALLVHGEVPLRNWLIWRYLEYWLITLLWIASCTSCGHGIIRRILPEPLPVLEQITMSFAIGVLAFFCLMFVGGLAGLYGPLFFVALPLSMLASGARRSFTYSQRLARGLRSRNFFRHRPIGLAPAALWGIGLIALFLFYLPGIVPSHISYDGAWYHVPLGEHYARLGRVERFPEGWFAGAMPHLASFVYCYAFLLPHGTVYDFVVLSSHLEFASVLLMLPGIPALVRRLVPGARAHASWVAFFSFPVVYWYDSLIGGDQFSALWSIPICLALLRTLPRLSWRHGLLLACGLAGEALTKYSASGILVGPILAVALRTGWLSGKEIWQTRSPSRAARVGSGGLVVGAALLALTTPLWLKNWLWYGDPLYPVLYHHLKLHPWTIDAGVNFRDFKREMSIGQPGLPGIEQAFLSTFTYAFRVADYTTGAYRGALFTLTCACIPLLCASWRLWVTAAVLHVAVFVWFLQMHQDRYLMATMPAMAAVTVAAVVLIWRTSLVARIALFALCAFHSIWGLGTFTLAAPRGYYRAVSDFATSIADGDKDPGMGDLARWERVGHTLPSNAKVLIHSWHAHTGLGHPSVSDWCRFEGGISYGRLPSALAVYNLLSGFGVTHMVWLDNHGDDSFASDLRFFEFATFYTKPRRVDGLWLGTLPETPPPAPTKPQIVAFLSCGDRYEAGLYPISALTVPNPRNIPQPPYPSPLQSITPRNANELLEQARYAVLNPSCGYEKPSAARGFELIGTRDDYQLFARPGLP